MTSLAVIIVNYRTAALAIASLDALAGAALHFGGLRAIVVDGCSGDGSAEALAAAVAVSPAPLDASFLSLSVNGGFAYANNCAMLQLATEAALPKYIALINPDARVRPGALEAMVKRMECEPRAGAIGARLEHEDGRPQASAFTWPSVRSEFCRGARTGVLDRLLRVRPITIERDVAGTVPWVTGAAVLFRTAALAETGLFDEGFFLYFEETDLMRRLTVKGWDIWHEPQACVVHHSGAATQLRDPETGLLPSRPMPRYWYESRRRYFALAGGRGYAIVASIAWLVGHLVYRTRRLLVPTATDGPLRPARDLIQRGFWPRPRDRAPAIPHFGAAPAEQPAWMKPVR